MRYFKKALIIFTGINLFLYLYIYIGNGLILLNTKNYLVNSHHHFQDDRIFGGRFNLVRNLGVWDSQWYLRNADLGYPYRPSNENLQDKSAMDGPSYAFFPLYPILLRAIAGPAGGLEAGAFVLSLILLGANFYSIYFVVNRLYSEKIAFRTSLLLFLFPFSLFLRSYYTEPLFLLIIIWYSYFLIRRDWLKISLLQGILLVTRPTGIVLLPVTFLYMSVALIKGKIRPIRLPVNLVLIFILFSAWLAFNNHMTGNPFYWKDIQSQWQQPKSLISNVLHNVTLLIDFVHLPFHSIHYSQVEIVMFFISGWLVFLSLSFLRTELWLISFIFWIFPVLIRDPISFSRYQSVSFPLFIYLASVLKGRYFALAASILFALLLFLSLYFVNWYWFG